jgi:hypothetical protein
MTLAPGDRLGPYQIVAPIGAGGMGEVFRARFEQEDAYGRQLVELYLVEGLS